MIFIPPPMMINPSNQQPAECPKCHKQEDIIEVCAHCGYEYEPDETSWVDGLKVILLILFLVWLVTTIVVWLLNLSTGDSTSLIQYPVSQFNFIMKAIKHIF